MEMVFQKSEKKLGGGGAKCDISHFTNKLFKSKADILSHVMAILVF